MNLQRTLVIPAVAALFLAAAPIRGAAQTLVPGNPPLTRKLMDDRFAYLEWLLDWRFTPAQRRDYQRHFIAGWNTANNFAKAGMFRFMTQNAKRVAEMDPAQSKRQRLAELVQYQSTWKKSPYPGDRWLLKLHGSLYRPGGPKNPILVEDDPPLAQGTVDECVLFMEWFLGGPLTDQQRQAYQKRCIKDWKACGRETKEARVRNAADWAKLIPVLKPFNGNFQRTRLKRELLAAWKKNESPGDGWAFDLYQAQYQPGGPRNEVLVEGEPPLTEEVVRRYGDYLEFVLDFSISGELTAAQRRILQDYLVADWKRWDRKARIALLAKLEDYRKKATRPMKEVSDWRLAEQARALARLRTARDDEYSQWLLEIVNQERQKYKLAMERERQRHETALFIIRNFPTGNPTEHGHWGYRNGRTVWVEDP
jgi:hypothetical protein